MPAEAHAEDVSDPDVVVGDGRGQVGERGDAAAVRTAESDLLPFPLAAAVEIVHA